MYKNLKFSWAHILLFLAIIYIGYVTYVGLTYKLDNGLTEPLIYSFGILLVLLFWFLGVQQLKGVDNNYSFKKCIWGERILFFTSPLIFIVCMIPFNHAWNVASHSNDIESKFRNAINSSTKMFNEYKEYSDKRISKYNDFLIRVKNNQHIQPTVYGQIGFDGKNDDKKIQIEVETLNRQLTAKFDSLNVEAISWIKRADQSTSVWNIFLVGNIKEIKTAITDWNSQMHDFSSVILSTENYADNPVLPFDSDSNDINATLSDLDSLSNIYTADDSISSVALILSLILYLMLISPYFVQKRNGVSTYTLLGRRWVGNDIETTPSKRSKSNQTEIGPIDMGDNQSSRKSKRNNETIANDISITMPSDIDVDDDEENEREERRRQRREKRAKRDTTSERRRRQHIDAEDDDNSFVSPIDDI